MDKLLLKQILRENQQEVERYVVEPRNIQLNGFPCRVLVGVRYCAFETMRPPLLKKRVTANTTLSIQAYLDSS